MNKVFLYGIAGATDQYRIVKYMFIDSEKEPITIRSIMRTAYWMKYKNPSIEQVYAIDDSASLARIYKNTYMSNSYANNVEFKLLLEKEGLKII